MISLEKLRAVKHLITHASCPDGVASALIVKDALPDVRVSFVAHGTEAHKMLEPEPGMLFCDFTPYPSVSIQNWIDMGCIVLDHHPTQRDITMRFVEAELGVYGENDRGECGAWLAYEYMWRAFDGVDVDAVREFAELAGVRDTWKRDDPRWQRACEQAEALMFLPTDWTMKTSLEAMIEICSDYGPIRIGGALFQKKLDVARNAIDESYYFFTQAKGTNVIVFQGVTSTSDAAEILEQRFKEHSPPPSIDIVAGFHYKVDAGKLKLQFSTRSHTGYDVGAFCKARGGGGHQAAAGFTIEQSAELGANPYAVFKLLLEEWEAGK